MNSIATVTPNGLNATVKAISEGEAEITVKTEDGGKTAICKVTVVGDEIPVIPVSAISVTTEPSDVSNLPNDGEVKVELSTSTSGASIYYTLDGSTPTKDSTLYEGPFTVTSPGDEGGTVTVKAIGIRSGYNDSAVATKK
jgi:uncharacterized protein YjdB